MNCTHVWDAYSILNLVIPILGTLVGAAVIIITTIMLLRYYRKSHISEKETDGYIDLLKPLFGRLTTIVLFGDSIFVDQFLDSYFPCDENRNEFINAIAMQIANRGMFLTAKTYRSKTKKKPLSDLQIAKLCFISIAERKTSKDNDSLFLAATQPIFEAINNFLATAYSNRVDPEEFRNFRIALFEHSTVDISIQAKITNYTNQIAALKVSASCFKYTFNMLRGDEADLEKQEQSWLRQVYSICDEQYPDSNLLRFFADQSILYFIHSLQKTLRAAVAKIVNEHEKS